MAKYTTQVRTICENALGYVDPVGFNDVESVIKNSLASVFNFDFPIFDESYRAVLESKILRHYYTREIGFETVGLWKLKLATKLNEIMPYYNQLYKSELLTFNPLYDVDIKRTHTIERSGSTSESNTGKNDSSGTEKSVIDNRTTNNGTDNYSDTPQGGLIGLEELNYLTNARRTTDVTQLDGDNTVTTTVNVATSNSKKGETSDMETYIETVTGKHGTADYSEMLLKFRQTFLNIDMMIITELEELFMLLW